MFHHLKRISQLSLDVSRSLPASVPKMLCSKVAAIVVKQRCEQPINLSTSRFSLSLVVLWLSAYLGQLICLRLRPLKEAEREDFSVVQAAILTLLGLLIGFTFSMADQQIRSEEKL